MDEGLDFGLLVEAAVLVLGLAFAAGDDPVLDCILGLGFAAVDFCGLGLEDAVVVDLCVAGFGLALAVAAALAFALGLSCALALSTESSPIVLPVTYDGLELTRAGTCPGPFDMESRPSKPLPLPDSSNLNL